MAVIAKDVCFAYEKYTIKNYILNGSSINVPLGSIYGLLGPSGCGKTTLLKCIIGLLKAKKGKILLFGYKPGDERSGVPGGGVGYMPQELAIQFDLTIEELLTYFGKLNFMKNEQINIEIEFLVKILDLCDKQRMIGELSGGQKRRVSLAIAMLHKPRLLILDEPTVGVDPILREVIWNLLINLSSSKKTTIIITTHYIDETKHANRVAFMRKGFILEENNPKALLVNYSAECLNDVFLKLCLDQRQQQNICDYLPEEFFGDTDILDDLSSVKIPYRSSTKYHIKHFLSVLYAIVWKYVIETRRNPLSISLVLLTTASIIFGVKIMIGQTPRDLPVAFVVEDQFNYSLYSKTSFSEDEVVNNSTHRNFNLNSPVFSDFNRTNKFETNDGEYIDLYLPDILKKSINSKIIKLIEYNNFKSAVEDAKKLIVRGIILLKQNFSKSYLDCDPLFQEIDEFVSNETIKRGSIHVYLDLANLVVGHTIRAVILLSLQSFRESIADRFDIDRKKLSLPIIIEPVNVEDKSLTSIEDLYSAASFMTPGFVVLNSFAICVGMCLLSLLVPMECNMFIREYSTGVGPGQRILGPIIARFIFMYFNVILNLLAMIFILDVPCRGSISLILILMWLQVLLGLNLGVLLSASMRSSYFILNTANSFMFIIFATNGLIWGIQSQPYYIKWFTKFSPLYHSTNTLRALFYYSDTSFQVIWPGFLFTILWIFIIFIITFFVYRLKK